MQFKFVVKIDCPDETVAEEIHLEIENKLRRDGRISFELGPLKHGK